MARAINDRGSVVGWHMPENRDGETAFHWQRRMSDVAPLPKSVVISDAADVNERGQVVGSSDRGGQGHAFLWENGRMTDLAVPTGAKTASATAINDRGQIVGTADRIDHGRHTRRGVLWTPMR